MADAQSKQEAQPWWAAFPAPKAECPTLEPGEVLRLLDETSKDHGTGSESARDFVLIDVRRTDWEGGTIATSINLPAQTLYQTRAAVYDLCKRAGVRRVIFYCGSCSHGGRGWRCANWMQDFIDEAGDKDMQALTVKGGIKGWVAQFGGRQMQWYEAAVWEQFK